MRSPRLTHPIPSHVWCVCFNLKCSPILFSGLRKKKKTILTYHHNAHKAKVCFGMVFFCPPQRSTKRFFDVETNQRDVFDSKKAPFRFPTSGVRFLPVVAPYPSLPITTKTGKFICWLPRSFGPAGWKRNPQVH